MNERNRPQTARDIFTNQSNEYIAFSSTSLQWQQIEKPAIDKHLAELFGPNLTVLDAGCGEGKVTRYLIEKGVSPKNITGVDLAAPLLTEAKRQTPHATFIEADLVDADLPEEQFDVIVCSMVSEYFDHETLDIILKNFKRWLKSDGTLLLLSTHPMKMILGDTANYQKRGWQEKNSPWNTPITIFHRTTSDVVNTTVGAGLQITTIDEPIMDERFEQEDPDRFKRHALSGASRLIVKAKKPAQ